jgi:hypothetical protein
MFDSGISVKELVAELVSEVDVALDIPNATYVTWLNSLQQLLYTEIIKEQKEHCEDWVSMMPEPAIVESDFDLSTITAEGELPPRFEDIHAVFADDTQLIKSTVTSGVIFPNTYYKKLGNLTYRTNNNHSRLRIIYYVKPALINVDSDDVIGAGNVMLPIEFIDLAKAKLRGEAYKLANEGDVASNWLNDYNILLETFKAWIAEKAPNFGL